MKKKTLKIIYHGEPDRINTELDKALEKCLVQFGYHRWVNGINRTMGERHIAFDGNGEGKRG